MEIPGLLIAWHFICAVWAGVIGEQRKCGFIAAAVSWLVFPVLGVAVLLSSDRK